MAERGISRNVQHVPKVWGVTYIKLFASIGVGLLITTVGFVVNSKAGIIGRIFTLLLGSLVTFALYGLCFWFERQDPIARAVKYLKLRWHSHSASRQGTRIYKTQSLARKTK